MERSFCGNYVEIIMKNFKYPRDDVHVYGEIRYEENRCFWRNEKELFEHLQANSNLVKGQLGLVVDHNNLRFAFPFGRKWTYQEEESKNDFYRCYFQVYVINTSQKEIICTKASSIFKLIRYYKHHIYPNIRSNQTPKRSRVEQDNETTSSELLRIDGLPFSMLVRVRPEEFLKMASILEKLQRSGMMLNVQTLFRPLVLIPDFNNDS